MADIDKSLPNEVRTEVEIPAEEVVEQEEIVEQGPVEVTPEEDGGATLNFEYLSVSSDISNKPFSFAL